MQNCKVGLLIGYNCSQALLPREVVFGKENEPYAQRTDLGWSIVGHGNPHVDFSDAIGLSHRIIVQQVTPMVKPYVNLKTKVNFVNRTKVKEITQSDLIRALELDFQEKGEEENFVSPEVLTFITLKDNITQNETGREMPLPVKVQRPNMPNIKVGALHRLKSLERRLRKDKEHYEDCGNFMTDISSCKEAKRVPEEETTNPTDASQGLRVKQLKNSNWFTGPMFLWQSTLPVKESMVGEIKDDDPELPRKVCNTTTEKTPSFIDHFQKCSDWTRLEGANARLKRFNKELKERKQRPTSNNLEVRRNAENTIITLVKN
ncbi:uncharacterized protein LOC111946692 [Oryzias latipes]|uniref:uncharacterized protein LOC111946692 n=1 Tax=Oryzias latipes TaxID=8090 RepID=UPI000CE18BD4|nr:uncharacterized protein LOC111946692 [Oryzias latipes]